MRSLIIVLTLTVVACDGCAKRPPPPVAPDAAARAAAILAGAAPFIDAMGNVARDRGEPRGCAAARASAAAMKSTASALRSVDAGSPELPAYTVTIADCGPTVTNPAGGVDAEVAAGIEAALAGVEAIVSASDARARDCVGTAWGLAALRQVRGAVGPAMAWDFSAGALEVPASPVDLTGCE